MTTVRARRKGRVKYILLALGFSFVLVLSLLPSLGEDRTVDTSKSVNTAQILSYDFRTYALNCTSQKHAPNGTVFRFSVTDLPYDFSTVSFGDYRSDVTYSHKYYGGSGILISATGNNATITLRESSGRFISSIDYHGQTQVVFNGMIESVTYPVNTTSYEGTEQIVQDWREAIWTPGDGILVEHPSKVTLSDAKFYVMVLEPSSVTEVPEFELLPIIGVVMALLVLVRRAGAKT